MKLVRSALILLVLIVAGTVAEAQCMRCYRVPPGWGGTCGEGFDDYCDRQCCGANIGDPCSIPDFIDPCDPWLRTASNGRASLLKLAPGAKPAAPLAYFTTSRPVAERQEAIHRRLQQLDPSAPRCGKS